MTTLTITSEQLTEIFLALNIARAKTEIDYEQALETYGESEFLTQIRKKDFEQVNNAFELVKEIAK